MNVGGKKNEQGKLRFRNEKGYEESVTGKLKNENRSNCERKEIRKLAQCPIVLTKGMQEMIVVEMLKDTEIHPMKEPPEVSKTLLFALKRKS